MDNTLELLFVINDYNTLFQFLLSLLNISLIANHLIGACQIYTYSVNVYSLYIHGIILLNNYYNIFNILVTNNFIKENFLKFSKKIKFAYFGFYNLILFSSFICISTNAEDSSGINQYEICSISSAILWGFNLNKLVNEYIIYKLELYRDNLDSDYDYEMNNNAYEIMY